MTADHRDPLSRKDRQEQTRQSLILAARSVFARDGYHKANLAAIAQEAGFSKGAVYSNFPHKAALFLAVMDVNMLTSGHADDCTSTAALTRTTVPDTAPPDAVRGFALATLEFIAVAARDHTLSHELAERQVKLTEHYTVIAEAQRHEHDPLTAGELGSLMAALDQGIGFLTLANRDAVPQELQHVGMQRLLRSSV
ncbi:TetR/AcrR family transcriptional regulator [Kocuria sp.]|uniref:TetR/AcrR family transcriptional regulator n=1 Tax=Kocuria sp. TaxID=1871328 RepID=UPI0026E04511|nr:TetR/AcrR family transcriptional regulator [Kocuria sp.]MDO5618248.1 helix-turn-helix domain-containing protein [Kocuria sp.]